MYLFFGKHWALLGLFQPHAKNILIKNMVHTCVFQKKSQKFVIFLGKMQVISALKANIGSFQQILVKYLPFLHPDISLITYFNIEYTKTLVKLREK